MLMLLLEKHVMWSRPDGRGGTIYYHYYDQVTWMILALAAIWIAWLLIRRHRRLRALRRPPRGVNYRVLERVVRIKDELSARYLAPGFSNNLHAVGIGRLATSGNYCIQFFVSDATQELWLGAGTTTLPPSYSDTPLIVIQMQRASLLVSVAPEIPIDEHCKPIRDYREVTIGGVSGANINLVGQSGTIGYFCRRKGRRWCHDVYFLSNTHVLVDLGNPQVSDGDLIMQPSPGERASNESIGMLTAFSPLTFADAAEPNFVDAAIGKLKQAQKYQAVLPSIGAVKGYVPKRDVEVGEAAQKFGRTTGYTKGAAASIYLDSWIDYDRTRQSAFFKNQILIEPALPMCAKVVEKGDSGSLVMDAGNYAIGLICAGRSPDRQPVPPPADANVPTIEGYGIANPISEVLDRLGIEMLIE